MSAFPDGDLEFFHHLQTPRRQHEQSFHHHEVLHRLQFDVPHENDHHKIRFFQEHRDKVAHRSLKSRELYPARSKFSV